MSDAKNQLSIYRASKLFTHLCVRDATLHGFKLVGGKMTIMTVKGYYDVKILQPASDYDDNVYIKFKGTIHKYTPDNKEWTSF